MVPRAYHAVTVELGVGLEDAVGGRVVSRGVHGVGARLVEGGGEAHIARGPAGDGDLGRHGEVDSGVVAENREQH